MLQEFKAFVLRGNVVDLAVGIVVGAAFTLVVTTFVDNILMPLIGSLVSFDFSKETAKINGVTFKWGLFVNAVISFLLTAAAVFFFVVKPVNTLMARRKTAPDVESTTKDCTECLSSIPAGAKRCPFCTSPQ